MNRTIYQRLAWRPFVKFPEGAKVVNRISRWGNKFSVEEYGRDQAITLYRQWLEAMPEAERRAWLAPLREAPYLVCCPPDLACHADVLIEFLTACA